MSEHTATPSTARKTTDLMDAAQFALEQILHGDRMEGSRLDMAAKRLERALVSHDALIQQRDQLLAAAKATIELYPQTYKCEPLSFEMTHIQPEDWRDVRAKLEAAIQNVEASK
jgi:hypothetical protein